MNGSCWQVPLLGGVFDKVFTSPETLTVQKLGVLYDAHPALALPDWASYTTLTIETNIGREKVFTKKYSMVLSDYRRETDV